MATITPATRRTAGTGSAVPAGAAGQGGLLRGAVGTALRGLTGLPLALVAVPLALVGRADLAARWQRAAAARWGARGAAAGQAAPRAGAVRVLVHSALVALPALAGLVATGLAAFTVYSGYLYFLRPDAFPALGHPFTADHRFDGAWGGPTLVGAWLVHSLVALGIQVAALLLVRLLTAYQDRCTRRLLGS